MTRQSTVVLAIIFLTTIGCGGSDRLPVIPVTGTVTMDGKPLENVSVTFHPESGRSANGVTNSEGMFRLTTYDTNDGATVGKHQISLSLIQVDIPEEIPDDYDYAADAASPLVTIPEKYLSPKTSGLISTIVGDEGVKEVSIVVE